jgi:hypothetical protein
MVMAVTNTPVLLIIMIEHINMYQVSYLAASCAESSLA